MGLLSLSEVCPCHLQFQNNIDIFKKGKGFSSIIAVGTVGLEAHCILGSPDEMQPIPLLYLSYPFLI